MRWEGIADEYPEFLSKSKKFFDKPAFPGWEKGLQAVQIAKSFAISVKELLATYLKEKHDYLAIAKKPTMTAASLARPSMLFRYI